MILFALLLTVLVVIATAGFAIKDGELDGAGHPFVGLLVADDADGNPLWWCSGTLFSPTLFLTAGHCTESPATRATIWFDSDIQFRLPDNGNLIS